MEPENLVSCSKNTLFVPVLSLINRLYGIPSHFYGPFYYHLPIYTYIFDVLLGIEFFPNKEFVYLPRVFPQVLLRLGNDKRHSQLPCKIVYRMYLNTISCLSVYRKSECDSGEIIPTRCNNCVYSSHWLYSTCFG